MKNIQESFEGMVDISTYLESCLDETSVNEGLKEVFQTVKEKFKKAWEYLKGIVIKAGSYFVPVGEDGEIMNAISPLTAGQAYKDGAINTSNTLVVLDRVGAKIVGLSTKMDQAKALYGSGNSISYWLKSLKECQEIRDLNSENETVNEVKLQNEDPQSRYNVIVDDDTLKKHIKLVLRNKKLARLMVWGAPGIGKTAILMNVLDEMKKDFPDYRLIVKTLSNETPDNFTLPTYVDTEGGRKADDVPKTWLPVYRPTNDPAMDAKLDEACGNGLLFVDELSRATPQVLNVILPLINEGIFNGYKLGSGWSIIAASNRAEDELAGQADIGNALANRFAQVYYEPTVKSWRKWADKQNFISPLLTQWLSLPESENMSGGGYYYMDPNEKMEDGGVTKLMCTPRAWTNAMRELACYSETGTLEGFTIFDIPTSILQMTLNKYIPADAIDVFVSFLNVIRSIGDFDQVVYDVWKNGGKNFKINKRDLNKVALPLAQLVCTSHNDKLPTEDEFNNLADWLIAQDSDQLASYVIDIFANTFAGMQSEMTRKGIFFLANKLKNKDTADSFMNGYAGFIKKWGLKQDNVPNYSAGLRKLGGKYQASFQSAIVDDHKDALG